MEDKRVSVVLHFRQAPDVPARGRSALSDIVRCNRDFALHEAKRTLEVHPTDVSKAAAVGEVARRAMVRAPSADTRRRCNGRGHDGPGPAGTREDVRAWREIRDAQEGIAGKVNGAHTELDRTAIRDRHRGLPRDTLAALYRAARVGLVPSLADGMTLVAKEYMAAQDPADPGVLVLSPTAGEMPLQDRRRPHADLLEGVLRDTVSAWCARFPGVLACCESPLADAAELAHQGADPGLHRSGSIDKTTGSG